MRRLAIAVLFGAALLPCRPVAVRGQDANLQRQIAESRRRLNEIRAERDRLEAELETARTGARDVLGELENVERQLDASRQVLAEMELQLSIATAEADEASRSLMITRDRAREANAVLQRRLRDTYKMGPLHTMRVLLGADSFADLLNRYRYVQMIASYDRALLERVGRLEDDLEERNQQLRANMANLGRLRESKLSELAGLRSVEAERQRALEALRDAEQEAVSELQNLDADRQRVETLIDDLEARRIEMERARASTGSTLTFADLGSLAWPLEGDVIYEYGLERRPNGTVLRWNGVGIASRQGSPVQAVRDGTVVLAGPFEGYGPTVVLSHGGGFYTLYLYLEEVGVVLGSDVKAGQVVGTVGGAGTPEGPHIEFQIRAPMEGSSSPQAQDPLQWLRPRR